ncbi:MAG: hypothetical protein ACYCYP_00440 [Leptospirales bacterium]
MLKTLQRSPVRSRMTVGKCHSGEGRFHGTEWGRAFTLGSVTCVREKKVDARIWIGRLILTILVSIWITSLFGCGVQGMPIPPEDVKKQKSS